MNAARCPDCDAPLAALSDSGVHGGEGAALADLRALLASAEGGSDG